MTTMALLSVAPITIEMMILRMRMTTITNIMMITMVVSDVKCKYVTKNDNGSGRHQSHFSAGDKGDDDGYDASRDDVFAFMLMAMIAVVPLTWW